MLYVSPLLVTATITAIAEIYIYFTKKSISSALQVNMVISLQIFLFTCNNLNGNVNQANSALLSPLFDLWSHHVLDNLWSAIIFQFLSMPMITIFVESFGRVKQILLAQWIQALRVQSKESGNMKNLEYECNHPLRDTMA